MRTINLSQNAWVTLVIIGLLVAMGFVDTVLAEPAPLPETHTLVILSPTDASDLETIWAAVGQDYTITAITCESDQTVTFDLLIDDGTPAGVNGSDITCTVFDTDSDLAGDVGLDAGERLDLAIESVADNPGWVSISWTVVETQ